MKIKADDNVLVIAGKDKGKTGKVMRVFKKVGKIVVEGVNYRVKHVKKTAQQAGQKIKFEAQMDASNAKVICPVTKKATRVGYTIQGKKKLRVAKKSKEPLDKKTITKK